MPPTVRFKRLDPRARLPLRATSGAAGLDLFALEGRVLEPGQRVTISTGLAVAIPSGYEGQVRPRSGLAVRRGVTILNAPGTIDSDYRGELRVALVNLGQETVTIDAGDRIAQLVIAPVTPCDIVEVESLDSTERGEGGFGSTGR